MSRLAINLVREKAEGYLGRINAGEPWEEVLGHVRSTVKYQPLE